MNKKGGYQEFFRKALASQGVSSLQDMGKEERASFLDRIDKTWKGEKHKEGDIGKDESLTRAGKLLNRF